MTLGGTTKLKDSSVETQDSSKGKERTPEKTPETLAQEKAVSDALAAAGRTAKAFESRETALKAREQAIKDAEVKAEERQKQKDAEELEAATDDAERSVIQRKQQLRVKEIAFRQKEEEHERKVAEHQAEIDAARATRFETEVWEIAAKHGVDAVWLKGLGISDMKQLDLIAKGASTQKGIVPDSGRTMGGGEIPASAKGKIRLGWDKIHSK
mgnify:CR=1 FL=1